MPSHSPNPDRGPAQPSKELLRKFPGLENPEVAKKFLEIQGDPVEIALTAYKVLRPTPKENARKQTINAIALSVAYNVLAGEHLDVQDRYLSGQHLTVDKLLSSPTHSPDILPPAPFHIDKDLHISKQQIAWYVMHRTIAKWNLGNGRTQPGISAELSPSEFFEKIACPLARRFAATYKGNESYSGMREREFLLTLNKALSINIGQGWNLVYMRYLDAELSADKKQASAAMNSLNEEGRLFLGNLANEMAIAYLNATEFRQSPELPAAMDPNDPNISIAGFYKSVSNYAPYDYPDLNIRLSTDGIDRDLIDIAYTKALKHPVFFHALNTPKELIKLPGINPSEINPFMFQEDKTIDLGVLMKYLHEHPFLNAMDTKTCAAIATNLGVAGTLKYTQASNAEISSTAFKRESVRYNEKWETVHVGLKVPDFEKRRDVGSIVARLIAVQLATDYGHNFSKVNWLELKNTEEMQNVAFVISSCLPYLAREHVQTTSNLMALSRRLIAEFQEAGFNERLSKIDSVLEDLQKKFKASGKLD